mmetsp:Transcript_21167/g.65328  ORF Transcript_21167/g.65328 Transcript_21167/m.65328 type:complete len:197 (+) Transcript_21167:148-738(+)
MDLRQHDYLLDDSEAIAAQRGTQEPQVPSGMSRETHELVMATMQGANAWRAERDAEEVRLREKRLAELRAPKTRPAVREVGPEAMLECIRKADVPVIVYVSDESPRCRRFERAIIDLDDRITNRPSDTRVVGPARPLFLKLHADDAGGAMHEVDPDALPALLVYKATELVDSNLNAAHAIRDADDLEDFLDDLGLF